MQVQPEASCSCVKCNLKQVAAASDAIWSRFQLPQMQSEAGSSLEAFAAASDANCSLKQVAAASDATWSKFQLPLKQILTWSKFKLLQVQLKQVTMQLQTASDEASFSSFRCNLKQVAAAPESRCNLKQVAVVSDAAWDKLQLLFRCYLNLKQVWAITALYDNEIQNWMFTIKWLRSESACCRTKNQLHFCFVVHTLYLFNF